MKFFYKLLISGVALLSGVSAVMADETPIVTIRTDAYEALGKQNKFTLKLASSKPTSFGIDCGGGIRQFQVNSGTLEGTVINASDTTFSVTQAGEIKIYGDATALTMLQASNAHISSIDLKSCINLTAIDLSANSLSEIDLSAQTKLSLVNLSNNNFSFVSLPAKGATWTEYLYQGNHARVPRAIEVGTSLDLSDIMNRPGSTTQAVVMERLEDSTLKEVETSAYTLSDGMLTINRTFTDSLYVNFTNSVLNQYPLETTGFMVKTADDLKKPFKTASFTLSDSFTGSVYGFIGMAGASNSTPKTFMYSVGGGNLKTATAKTSTAPNSYNIFELVSAGSTIDIYVPEGEDLTAISLTSQLKDIDVTEAPYLRSLQLGGCGLPTIDLSRNRDLYDINLQGNALTTLNLRGINSDWEKKSLQILNVSKNKLDSIFIPVPERIVTLNLSENNLSSISLEGMTLLNSLNLSQNNFSGTFDLTQASKATYIYLSGNKITNLICPEFSNLSWFDIHNNNMTFATVPYLPNQRSYNYAPQNQLQLPSKMPYANLSEQNVMLDGDKGTSYVWMHVETGSELKEGTDYECKDGVTKFLKSITGKVYCKMTNPAFPAFTDANALQTTQFSVTSLPTTVVASFTPNEEKLSEITFESETTTGLFFDFLSDQSSLVPFVVDPNTPSTYSFNAEAGKEVKIYTYDDLSNISRFNLNDTKLEKVDASQLSSVQNLSLANAQLTNAQMSLPKAPFKTLILNGNRLSEFSTELILAPENLSELNLSNNCFTFLTLPRPNVFSSELSYNYLNQAEVDAAISGNGSQFDLSSLASVDNTPTSFAWYEATPAIDPVTGEISGNKLNEGTDYTIEGGVTSFIRQIPTPVVCVMSNSVFPGLYLFTPQYTVQYNGVETIGEEVNTLVDVIDLAGRMIRRNVARSNASEGLAKGLYIIGGKKVIVK